MEQYLHYIGGGAGALALTGVAAASAFYLASRPSPQKPLFPLDAQCIVQPVSHLKIQWIWLKNKRVSRLFNATSARESHETRTEPMSFLCRRHRHRRVNNLCSPTALFLLVPKLTGRNQVRFLLGIVGAAQEKSPRNRRATSSRENYATAFGRAT